MNDETRYVLIGWDPREDVAYHVCVRSLLVHSTVALAVQTLNESVLRSQGLYWRPQRLIGPGHGVDLGDGRPFSTEFAFTRFLVPVLMNYTGPALFTDLDFLWRADVAELFALFDERYAVQCVKHDHRPVETVKMDAVPQDRYPRKNWSSLVLWNCGHPANRALTVSAVNTNSGRWLHGFEWLDDEQIGELPEKWNWLEGHSDPKIDPAAVHYTRGGPWFQAYRDVAYADEWRAHLGEQRS